MSLSTNKQYEPLTVSSLLHLASEYIQKSEFDICIGEVPDSIFVDKPDQPNENEGDVVLHIRTTCDNIYRITKSKLEVNYGYDYVYTIEQLKKDKDTHENTDEYETIYTKMFLDYNLSTNIKTNCAAATSSSEVTSLKRHKVNKLVQMTN